MDERSLLLLGLLKMQSQHGYQINEFIEKNMARVTDMKKATAYAILDRLSDAGYITVHSEQEGNRPPRKVYSITPTGEEQFFALLRTNLSEADPMLFPSSIGLMFLDHLPRPDVVACLNARLAAVEERIASFERAPKHRYNLGASLAVEHLLTLMQADRDWLVRTLEQLGNTK